MGKQNESTYLVLNVVLFELNFLGIPEWPRSKGSVWFLVFAPLSPFFFALHAQMHLQTLALAFQVLALQRPRVLQVPARGARNLGRGGSFHPALRAGGHLEPRWPNKGETTTGPAHK